MSWEPQATVTINGVDYSGNALETVNVTRGRDDVFQEPRAGYVYCGLIDLDGSGIPVQPLDRISVTIADSTGAQVPVFAGTISDTAIRLYDNGAESGVARSIMTVIAVGPLARMNRRIVAVDGRAEEKDGDRIAYLIEEALAAPWDETGGTWDTVATATTTWDTFDLGLDLSLVDQPGVYDIAAIPADSAGYSPLAQAYQTAFSGRGTIFDTATGFIAYADGDHRRTASNAGYFQIPNNVIEAAVIETRSVQADVTNRLALNYAGGTLFIQADSSVFEYGVLSQQLDTNLANLTDATDWATDYLEDRARPSVSLPRVGIRLEGVSDDTLRDNLLALDVGSPVVLDNLPITLGLQTLPAFVEGLEWRIGEKRASITFNISDAQLSLGAVEWEQVVGTIDWDSVSATLTWQNASEVTT